MFKQTAYTTQDRFKTEYSTCVRTYQIICNVLSLQPKSDVVATLLFRAVNTCTGERVCALGVDGVAAQVSQASRPTAVNILIVDSSIKPVVTSSYRRHNAHSHRQRNPLRGAPVGNGRGQLSRVGDVVSLRYLSKQDIGRCSQSALIASARADE